MHKIEKNRIKSKMQKERKILLDEFNKWTNDDLVGILKNVDLKDPKSAEASEKYRKKGNTLLMQQKRHDAETHKAIFSHYCKSIALAPMKSQKLAFAYGNRSYLLLHMHKYEDCIKDIDRALKLANCDTLKAKLLCRKVECLKRLGSSKISSIIEMVQNLSEKIDGQDRIKLLKMFDAVKALVVKKTNAVEMSSEKTNELPLTDDYSSRVSIQYSEKYGRHLVAAKDYKPGDIIFVEKMYATAFMEGSSLLACDYCLKPLWSSIPCNYCNWAMYCSESCKEEAWNDYHDIECSLVSHLKQCHDGVWKSYLMPVRVLITGIKETGGIANLKKELELLDESAYIPSTTFFKNDKFAMNSIQSVYSLASYAPHESLVSESLVIPLILNSLTRYSNLKDNFDVKRIEDLAMNEDVIFLGSLLIKIVAILSSNALSFTYDEFNVTCKPSDVVHFNDTRCLSTLFSLLNHSCFPTTEWRCIEKNKLLVYALQPIKKDSQIFINYGYSFEKNLKSIRQKEILEKYNFMCDCQACSEAWPPIIKDEALDQEKLKDDLANYGTSGKISMEIVTEVRKVLEGARFVDESLIEKLSSLITQCSNGKQPSPMLCSFMTNLLKEIFTAIYSPKSLLFKECK